MFEKKSHNSKLRWYVILLVVCWSVSIIASLIWNIIQINLTTTKVARNEARIAHAKDVVYRRWNASHGGLYAPVTEQTPPNPYLKHPERDIKTPSGKPLTLINPAYMTRQVNELFESTLGIRAHLTSLKPIRPSNVADAWEAEALKAFEQGESEVSSTEPLDGEEYFRLMRPLITKKSCLKCHSLQGYKEGDIRGGISVSIPMKPLRAIALEHKFIVVAAHSLLWLLGVGGIGYGTKRVKLDETRRQLAEDELKESEEKFRTLIDTAYDAIFITDVETGKIIATNKKAEKLLGIPAEKIIGAHYTELYPKEDYELYSKRFQMAIQKKEDIITNAYVVDKDGNKIPVDISANVTTVGGKNLLQGIFRDITERKRAEKEILTLNEELEQKVVERTKELEDAQEKLIRKEKLALLGQLSGSVGHELRNPLTAISNAIYYLKMVLPDADKNTKEHIGIISSGVNDAKNIISNLLDFSRTRPSDKEEVSISELITQVLEKYPPPKEVKVTTEINADLPAVYIDPNQIEMVLTNLVINACQAMPDGGNLTINAEDSMGTVRILVNDSGCGISSKDKEKIFEPLFTTKKKGVGIGLALAKNLVEANDGIIEVKTNKDKGTTFTITLPIKK